MKFNLVKHISNFIFILFAINVLIIYIINENIKVLYKKNKNDI